MTTDVYNSKLGMRDDDVEDYRGQHVRNIRNNFDQLDKYS